MRRYGLFMGLDYYPEGGWLDFKGSFSSVAAALSISRQNYNWWHIVDLETGKIIQQGEA